MSKVDASQFLRNNQIPDDYLIYRFRLSTFKDGPTGFIERIIKSLEEYGVPVDEDILIEVLSQIKQLNIILHEKKFWDKVELKPRISGGYELIFECLINIFIPYFLKSLGAGFGFAIPYILKKKADAAIEVEKQKELKKLEIKVFKEKIETFKKLIEVKGLTHEELLKDIAVELSKVTKSPTSREHIFGLIEEIKGVKKGQKRR